MAGAGPTSMGTARASPTARRQGTRPSGAAPCNSAVTAPINAPVGWDGDHVALTRARRPPPTRLLRPPTTSRSRTPGPARRTSTENGAGTPAVASRGLASSSTRVRARVSAGQTAATNSTAATTHTTTTTQPAPLARLTRVKAPSSISTASQRRGRFRGPKSSAGHGHPVEHGLGDRHAPLPVGTAGQDQPVGEDRDRDRLDIVGRDVVPPASRRRGPEHRTSNARLARGLAPSRTSGWARVAAQRSTM